MSFKLCLSCTSKRKRRAGSVDSACPSSTNDTEQKSLVGSGVLDIPSIFVPIEVDSPALMRPHSSAATTTAAITTPRRLSWVPYSKIPAPSSHSSLESLKNSECDFGSLSSISLTSSTTHDLGNDLEATLPLLARSRWRYKLNQSGDVAEDLLLIGDDGSGYLGESSDDDRVSSPVAVGDECLSYHKTAETCESSINFHNLNLRHIDSDSCCSSSTTSTATNRHNLQGNGRHCMAVAAGISRWTTKSGPNDRDNSKTILGVGNGLSSGNDRASGDIKTKKYKTILDLMVFPALTDKDEGQDIKISSEDVRNESKGPLVPSHLTQIPKLYVGRNLGTVIRLSERNMNDINSVSSALPSESVTKITSSMSQLTSNLKLYTDTSVPVTFHDYYPSDTNSNHTEPSIPTVLNQNFIPEDLNFPTDDSSNRNLTTINKVCRAYSATSLSVVQPDSKIYISTSQFTPTLKSKHGGPISTVTPSTSKRSKENQLTWPPPSDNTVHTPSKALDLASQSNVQDAFVIAVEQQARERLEKLSALKRIKPVDMTKLSQQLSEVAPTGETSELNGLIEAATGSPIYVTSVPELSSSQAALHRTTAGDFGGDAFTTTTTTSTVLEPYINQQSPRRTSDSTPSPTFQGKQGSVVTGRRLSVDGLTARSPVLLNGIKQTQLALTTGTAVKGRLVKTDTQGHTSLIVGNVDGQLPNGQYSGLNAVEKPKASPKPRLKEDLICEKVREDITGSQESVEGTRSSTSGKGRGSKTSSRESVVETSQYANMMNMVEWDNGPHREMAVDVPESFVPRNKTPPRYPPATKPTNLTNNNKIGRSVVSGRAGNGIPVLPGQSPPTMAQNGAPIKPVPPPRINEKDEWTVNNNNTQAQAPQVTPRTILLSPNKSPQVSPSIDQADRIKKYQEDLRKRREQEDRLAQEEEFLRTSLRGSKKLQALETVRTLDTPSPHQISQTVTGFVNDAYEALSEDHVPYIPHQEALLKKPVGISELVASLQRVQEALKKNGMQLEDTVSAVGSLMKKPEFHQVLAVHNKVQEVWCFNSPPTPISAHSHQIVQECLGCLFNCSVPESAELVNLLSRVDLEGVLYAHDKIAERERLLMVSETPSNLGESVDEIILPKSTRPTFVPEPQPDDHIKVVRIDKTQDPLGATVRNEGEAVIIGRIVKGGAAEKSGLLHEGDEVLEVNGIEMRGKSVNEVCDILSRMTGTLTFLIIPDPGLSVHPPMSQRREILIHVRAHFDYDPEDDIYVPCRELGIAFSKGDVLHVISQDDPNWWQAHREGEEDQALAGLIPSKSFQEQRETVKQTLLGETETREKSKRGTLLLCAKTHKKKKKKIPYSTAFNDDFDAEEIPTYEEVALYYPRTSFKRPVVLIGPPNIGRHELRQRLMLESDRFAAAVPHTSRGRKDGEVDGQDYHFITRAQFEADILGRKFVEHGEFEKAYYGTSLDAIRSVVNIGRICVLNLHPQSLKILRNSDLKPYIVFVAPPPLERLKQLRISRGEAYKEDELIDIIEKAREMEEKYGHYFDLVIINNDIERTYHELVQRINYIEREPQWVPAFWLKQ